jgi:hypothetical protein
MVTTIELLINDHEKKEIECSCKKHIKDSLIRVKWTIKYIEILQLMFFLYSL